jgi:hypothetical protein
MSMDARQAVRWGAGVLAIALVAGAGGFWLGQRGDHKRSGIDASSTQDPLLVRSDGAGGALRQSHSLSSMGMKTVPKYADEAPAASAVPGVSIDPAARQNPGCGSSRPRSAASHPRLPSPARSTLIKATWRSFRRDRAVLSQGSTAAPR